MQSSSQCDVDDLVRRRGEEMLLMVHCVLLPSDGTIEKSTHIYKKSLVRSLVICLVLPRDFVAANGSAWGFPCHDAHSIHFRKLFNCFQTFFPSSSTTAINFYQQWCCANQVESRLKVCKQTTLSASHPPLCHFPNPFSASITMPKGKVCPPCSKQPSKRRR
jgi:hypothetical protein